MKSKNDIRLLEGNTELLNEVKPLWEKLNSYHSEKSIHFKDKYLSFNFEQRALGLCEKAKDGKLMVYLAFDYDKLIGYCISTIDNKNLGEIESLYVEDEYRGCNIGDYFMKKSLQWMENYEVKEKRIGVAGGNEDVFSFYKKYGFYPKTTILAQK